MPERLGLGLKLACLARFDRGRCAAAANGRRAADRRQSLRCRQARLRTASGRRQIGGNPAAAKPREPSDFDRELYKARHLIENFFWKLKQFRAITTRYDKIARNFLAAIHLAAAIIRLN